MVEKKPEFSDLNISKNALKALEALEFTLPTPIQYQSIGPALGGQPIMGIAPTGTGKTAAYLLPLITKLSHAKENMPRVLILVPTRELTTQVKEWFDKLAQFTDLRAAVLYGGVGMQAQLKSITAGTDIVISTPGRFLDVYATGELNVKKIAALVIDEADKMMDMGFVRQIHRILEIIPQKKQHFLFSATMSNRVEMLAADFLDHPTIIKVSPPATTAETIDQSLIYIPNFKTKINYLQHFFKTERPQRVMIFVRTKARADNVYKYVARKHYGDNCLIIHGNKAQSTRINALDKFSKGEEIILVATDVAARGLDISGVSHVINFDVPMVHDDYVHRIGRTGRAGNDGISITLCSPDEAWHLNKIQKLIKKRITENVIPEGVFIEETMYDEKQEMDKVIDHQKRMDDPDFRGAFHDKKPRNAKGESNKKIAEKRVNPQSKKISRQK